MNNELLNILSNSNKDIDNQKLMDYLAGKLSAEERHEIEKAMADNAFMNDAMEGLAGVKDKTHLAALVDQLNNDLQQKTEKKKQRKEKRRLKEYPWINLAVIVILALIIIVWFVIRKMQR